MRHVQSISLLTGWLPVVVAVLGVVGALWLVARRDRRYWRWAVPGAVAVTVLVVAAVHYLVEHVWHPFPDPLPSSVYGWFGAGLLAVALLVPRAVAARGWTPRAVTVLAVVAVVLAAAMQVNAFFGEYPTVGTALGAGRDDQVDFSQLAGADAASVASLPLADAWTPPADLPTEGRLSQVSIPGAVSGFATRPGYVYVPPAYLTTPRAVLPVLVLLSGQPGTTEDWLNGGRLTQVMDAWAARHGGLTPVVVLADSTGTEFGNPLCLDSRLGQAQTYLTVDVPAWIRANLQVQEAPAQWAVGGFSYGGTCALQLGVNRPDVYPTMLDVSGQDEPTLGTRTDTVAAAFGGDAARYAAVNPLDLLAARRFPGSAITVVAGSNDSIYRPEDQRVADATRAAGIDTRFIVLDGGHDYGVWGAGLSTQLDWLGTRSGITR